MDVLNVLLQETVTRIAVEGKELSEQYEGFQDALRTCIVEHTFLKHHASLVRDNAERLATQVIFNILVLLGHRANADTYPASGHHRTPR
jgi:hypothetical protein